MFRTGRLLLVLLVVCGCTRRRADVSPTLTHQAASEARSSWSDVDRHTAESVCDPQTVAAKVRLAGAALQPPEKPPTNAPALRPGDGVLDRQSPSAGRRFLPPPAVPVYPRLLSDYGKVRSTAQEPLTLEVMEVLASQNNPTLLQAQAHIQGALGEAIQAGLLPNPTLVYVGEQLGAEGTAGEFQGGVVRQRIVTARKLDLSREKYLARTRVAEWIALGQQYRVLNDVRTHYFRARGRQELLAIRRELLKNAEDNVVTRREMYNAGQATQADIHQANVDLQKHRLEVLMAENDYRQAFEELTSVVGLEIPPALLATPLEGDLAPIDWEQALERLLRESPQMLVARSKLEADRITIRREIAEPVPDLVLQGGTGYNFEAQQAVASASASIEVPIFDWNQGTIRQAEADFARQQGEVRRTELVLRREMAREYRRYLTALQHVRNYQDVILPEARRAYELLLQSYDDDRAPWSDVLTAQRQFFLLRGEYVSNLTAWRESEVRIMGYLLNGGLEAPSNPTPPGHINSLPKPR